MTRWRLAAATGGLVATTLAAANAAPVETRGASQCQTRAFSTDVDPDGTNVRSAPRADAPFIGRLAPRARLGPDVHEGVEFELVGSEDGWLLVQKADPAAGLTFAPANQADGRGWIPGHLVGVVLGNRSLRAAPRRDGPIVADLSGPNWGPDSFVVSAVHACVGRYVEVTGKGGDGVRRRGWSFSPCSNQLTTCDGASTGE